MQIDPLDMYQSLVIDHEEFRDIQLFDIKTEPVEQVLSCLDPAPWFEKNKYVKFFSSIHGTITTSRLDNAISECYYEKLFNVFYQCRPI